MYKLDKIFSVLAVVAGVAVMIISVSVHMQDNRIKKTGNKAIATVIDTVVTISKPRTRSYDSFRDKTVYGIYQFKATDGKTYQVQAATSGAHLGKKTIVYYNPGNPEHGYFLDSDAYGFFLGIGIGLVIIIFGVFMYRRGSK